MTTHTIKGFVTHTTYPWSDKPTISFCQSNEPTYDGGEYTVAVCPFSFTVDVPDNFDPNPLKVEGMRKQIDKIKVAAFDEISNLQQSIEKLLAISYVAPAEGTDFVDPPADVIEFHTATTGDLNYD